MSAALVLNKLRSLELSQTSKMEPFNKIANGSHPLTIFRESFILNVWQGSEFTSGYVLISISLLVGNLLYNEKERVNSKVCLMNYKLHLTFDTIP